MIQTVTGKIDNRDLGLTLSHEHLTIDLTSVRGDEDSVFDDVELMVDALRPVVEGGFKSLIEVTNMGMGRTATDLRDISRMLNMNIIASTGYYQFIYYPEYVLHATAEEISKQFVRELELGMDDTDIKAGVIAEIGSSFNCIRPEEEKVFIAAAKAHGQTGAGIITHCEQGTMAHEQLALLRRHGVSVNKVIMGHMDLVEDIGYLERLLESGVTIGKAGYVSDERRLSHLLELLDKGYSNQLTLSMDITRKSYLEQNGGHGYGHLQRCFIPKLKAHGISDAVISRMLCDNLVNFLSIE